MEELGWCLAEHIGGYASNILGMFIVAVGLILIAVIWWRIFSKAGYPGLFGLMMLLPLVNLVLLLVLAFATWPIHRELAAWKQFRSHRWSPP